MFPKALFYIHNLISLSLLLFAVSRSLIPKYRQRTMLLLSGGILSACTLLAYFSERYPFVDTVRPFVMMAIFFSSALFLYQDKPFRKLLVMLCNYFALLATEVFMYLANPAKNNLVIQRDFSVVSPLWYVLYLGCQSILLLILYIAFRRKKLDDVDSLPIKQYWFFLFFPISQFVLLNGALSPLIDSISLRASILVAGFVVVCIIADYIWFRQIRKMTDNVRLQMENDLLGKRIEAQREYYKTLSANYADMAVMRHDIANHIYSIRALLQDGKPEEAMQYATELEKSRVAQDLLSDCKNSVVQSFLRHKLGELQEQKLSADFRVNLAPVTGISDTDLIIALGNMLDNATEACAAAPQREIRLTVKQSDGYVQIETENTCPQSITPHKRRIAYLKRGLGTSILQALAEQYHGKYLSVREDGINHAVLTMQESKK